MAVPKSYKDNRSYFDDCLKCLKEYDWIYNYPNTHLLVNKTFDKIPTDWFLYLKNLASEKINKLALGEIDESAPEGFKDMLYRIRGLKPDIKIFHKPETFSFPKNVSIGDKKRHEICALAPFIQHVCKEHNTSKVIDVGCGIGYLSHILYEKYKLNISGIEGCPEKVKLAQEYQQKYYNSSTGDVKFFQHFITEESLTLLNESANNASVCIAGLHACADLSITILKIFAEMKSSKCLVVMPCCYHRLKLTTCTDFEDTFENFPCSDLLRWKYNDMRGSLFLRRPFLRLATQQSNASWRDMTEIEHDVHAKNCLFRAILEEIAEEGNWSIKRLKRKSGKPSSTKEFDAESFAQSLSTTHLFLTQENTSVDYKIIQSKFLVKWSQNKENLILTEAISALQTVLQGVCENVVLLDRVEYLKQRGLHATVYKVTDDRLSPRCFALVATKQ